MILCLHCSLMVLCTSGGQSKSYFIFFHIKKGDVQSPYLLCSYSFVAVTHTTISQLRLWCGCCFALVSVIDDTTISDLCHWLSPESRVDKTRSFSRLLRPSHILNPMHLYNESYRSQLYLPWWRMIQLY